MDFERFSLRVQERTLAGYRMQAAPRPACPPAAVCLIHGTGEHAGRYGHTARHLAARGYSVFACDLPGHGHSPGARGDAGGRKVLLAAVDALLQTAAAHAPGMILYVMGHSMGGNIALSHRLFRPQARVRGYVVSAPWLRIDNPLLEQHYPASLVLRALFPLLRVKNGLPDDWMYTALAGDAADAGRPDALAHPYISVRTAVGRAQDARAVLAQADRTGLSPVYLFYGEDDRACLPAGARLFAQRAQGHCTLHTFPGMRHETLNEAGWHAVADAAADWMDALR